jgi:glycosyltransferase involved in cell wall biosynthesis
MISFILPTRNNLPYVKTAISSIRRFYLDAEIVLLDDSSTDGTDEWVAQTYDPYLTYYKHEGKQIGHTVLYDIGVRMCKHDIFSIFHADMVCGPKYIENLLKHLKPGMVVSATRIEPPLHPPGKEKIVMDFGLYADGFKTEEFLSYCLKAQEESSNRDVVTKGIFAPWAMFKADFIKMGGHDAYFSPFPYEDSDIFQRFILNGYEIKQSRDAFAYHFTCRGHRWTEQIQKDDYFYKLCCAKNQAHFIRKWGSWIKNDEYSYPKISPLYDIGFIVKNCSHEILGLIEPWCSTIYNDCPNIEGFIQRVQPGTPFDLTKRIKNIEDEKTNQILISFDGHTLNQTSFHFLTQLPDVLKDSGEIGNMQFDIFDFEIKGLETFESNLIQNDNEWHTKRLVTPSESDKLCTDELFKVFQCTK